MTIDYHYENQISDPIINIISSNPLSTHKIDYRLDNNQSITSRTQHQNRLSSQKGINNR